MRIDPTEYGPELRPLIAEERLPGLTLGPPNEAARKRLQALTVETGVGPRGLADRDMARACLAGLWLYHDFGDEAHAIAQEIHTFTGSFWHGIYHRREPDAWNSKYWFGRVRRHPVFEALRAAADAEAQAAGAADTLRRALGHTGWNPSGFVDLCQAALGGEPALEALCRRIQQREWELLFDHCYRCALGMERDRPLQ